jgi:4a-hydroxytetrahydrobiopterin dehydratase
MALLNADERAALGRELTGWTVGEDSLERRFEFKDFGRSFGFMASVALAAEKLGHHPDWSNSYNRVSIRLTTHDAGGLTDKDAELARRISQLAE